MPYFTQVPEAAVPNHFDATNDVTAINMRNRALLFASNNPNTTIKPSSSNHLNNTPNDEASESQFFADESRKISNKAIFLDGAADKLTMTPPTEGATEKKENVTENPQTPSFFRCCQCQHTSRSPNCQRPNEEIGVVQAKEQRILIVNSECQHAQCMRCVNVDERGVRIGVQPWELNWRDPAF